MLPPVEVGLVLLLLVLLRHSLREVGGLKLVGLLGLGVMVVAEPVIERVVSRLKATGRLPSGLEYAVYGNEQGSLMKMVSNKKTRENLGVNSEILRKR